MPQVTVTTETTLTFRRQVRPLLQNLGPDDLYFGREADPASNGFRLQAGEDYEYPESLWEQGGPTVYVASSGSSDLRYAPAVES